MLGAAAFWEQTPIPRGVPACGGYWVTVNLRLAGVGSVFLA